MYGITKEYREEYFHSKYDSVGTWDYKKSIPKNLTNGRWEQDTFKKLYTRCLKISDIIIDPNYIIASPAVVMCFETFEQFYCHNSRKVCKIDGVFSVGVLGRFDIYRDLNAKLDYAIVGHAENEVDIQDRKFYLKVLNLSHSALKEESLA
jgi:hypothetical protein